MDDLISRQAIIEAIEKCHKMCCRKDACGDEWIHYETVLNEIECIPPAEPKRGKWNRLGRDVFNCNKCGATFVLNQGGEKMRFCPNCGADMRGDKNA